MPNAFQKFTRCESGAKRGRSQGLPTPDLSGETPSKWNGPDRTLQTSKGPILVSETDIHQSDGVRWHILLPNTCRQVLQHRSCLTGIPRDSISVLHDPL